MRDLLIFGAGGFAREVHQLVLDLNEAEPTWNVVGFLDGDPARQGKELHGLPILGDATWIGNRPDVSVTVAIGGTPARRRVVGDLAAAGCSRFVTLVHPLARVGRGVECGVGTIVCAGNILTTDLRLGHHVILNLACTVGHDVVIGDFVTLAPGVHLSGAAVVEEGADLGTGSSVVQGRRVGAWSVVGAGAVVIRDLPPNVTAVGMPARPIKERPPDWHLE